MPEKLELPISYNGLLDACRKGAEALKNILGAADNDQPYTRDELFAEFLEEYNDLHDTLIEVTGHDHEEEP